MNVKVSGWLAAAGLLLATACSTDQPTVGSPDNGVTDGEVTVSFSVSPVGRANTRAESSDTTVKYPEEGEYAQISDGTKAHVLIYAVYDSEKKLLEQYGNELADDVKDKLPSDFTLGEGQTLLYVDKFPTTDQPIKLRLMRNKTYHIAFWAQAANTTAYDTSDLTQVKVNYENAVCNDELRDAFCHTEIFSVSGDETRDILLVRPMAQINVGTAGFDFEAAVRNGDSYLYSKILVNGVAEYLDVVSNKVLTTQADFEEHGLEYKNDGLTSVDFKWNRIPAYWGFEDEDNETLFGDDEADKEKHFPNPWLPKEKGTWKTAKEQFLRVDRNFDGEYAPYISFAEYETLTKAEQAVYTETYKYLAMCYVLVPFITSENNGDLDNDYGRTVDNVNVMLAQASIDEDGVKIDETKTITVVKDFDNVPVQKNWRTNILSNGLLTIGMTAEIDIVPEQQGDFNIKDDGTFEEKEYPATTPDDDDDNGDADPDQNGGNQ